MEEAINISPDDYEITDSTGYRANLTNHFDKLSKLLNPFIEGAKRSFNKVEEMIYSAPTFIELIKSVAPKEIYQAIFFRYITRITLIRPIFLKKVL